MAFTTAFAREAAAYGVPASIVGKIVQTEPDRVTWLDPSDLAAMHVQIIGANDPGGPALPSQDFDRLPSQRPLEPSQSVSGTASSWIQIFSRALFSEALNLGAATKDRFSNVRIFKCLNGWYAVVLGPYEPATALEVRDELAGSGGIPRDSLVTRGIDFQQLAWANEVGAVANTSANPDGRLALEAATSFFRTWTLSNREALSFLDRVYPPQLLYFGKKSSKAYVMADKQAFVQRWPHRAYSIRPGSVSTSCVPTERLMHG